MTSQAHRRFTYLLLATFSFTAPLVHAQSRACPQQQATETDSGQETKVSILNVEFPRDFPLSEAARIDLEKEIRNHDIATAPESADSEWWVENYVDWRIREELRKEGYFKANVHSRPYLVLAKADEMDYIVAVEAESGLQYRLGRLQFKNANPDELHLAMGADELRDLIPLRPGNVFDVSTIRKGLEEIGKLYGKRGYINAIATPETNVDEKAQRIDLVVNIDEELQYHVGKFEVAGLDSKTAKSLESLMEPGQIFNRALLEKLFEDQKNVLPADSSMERNAVIIRNTKYRTVGIVLDFRPCPQT